MTQVLFRNCAVFDGVSDDRQSDMNVLVDGNVIKEMSDRPIAAPGSIEIDVGGRTLMPGLIDAHVHAFAVNLVASRNESMPLTLLTAMARPRIRAMLTRGFTSVRDTGGADVGIRDAVAQGYFEGPRLFVAGPSLTQTGGHGDHRHRTDSSYDADRNANALNFQSRLVDGPIEMRRAVRDELRKGSNHIKVMASGGVGSPTDHLDNVQFSKEELTIAVEESARRGCYVCAHAYTKEAIRHCVACGIRTVEHANFIDEPTALFVKEHGAFVVPTMVCYEETHIHGGRLGLSPFVMDKLRLVREAGINMLEICQRTGVKMGFGTDLMGELASAQSNEFVIRGRVLRPVDVLRSATSVNAEIIQQTGKLGVIAPGALADMIVVDGNPLQDLSLMSNPDVHFPVIMKDGAFFKNALPMRQSSSKTYVNIAAGAN